MGIESGNAGINSWPVPVNVFTGRERVVRLNQLPKALKQKAWNEIQENNPALAKLLRDGTLQMVVEQFDASIYIDAEIAPCLPPEPLRGRSR